MVLDNFMCWGILLVWIRVGQGPTVHAVGASGSCLDIFSSPGRSPGKAIILPLASASASVLVLAAA